jgi:hypothetical protein
MNTIIKRFLIVCFSTFTGITLSNAQADFSFALGAGGMYYNGDLSDKSLT